MIEGICIEGLVYGIMVLGVFLEFRILNFCDMTVDGSFPMGACVLAACLTRHIHPLPALLLVFAAGLTAGCITSLIYTKLKIPDILAGILCMTMLYSVNLRIMSNRSNVSFLKIPTPFSQIMDYMEHNVPSLPPETGVVLLLIIGVGVLKLLLDVFFHTDLGLTMGALGANPQMVISQGVNPRSVRTIGICFGNGLAALAGACAAMYGGFADVGSGTGVVVSGLASLMLGEFILRSNRIGIQTLRVLIGSLVYRGIMFTGRIYGYKIGLTSNDLRLITGLLIILCLAISNTDIPAYFREHLRRREGGVQ